MTSTIGPTKTGPGLELVGKLHSPGGIPPAEHIFALALFAARIMQIKKWMQNLTPAGRKNWEEYRNISQSFIRERERLQFLTLTPAEIKEMQEFARLPEEAFTKFGIARWDFLTFMGFANLCQLPGFEQTVAKVKGNVQAMQAAGEDLKAGAGEKLIAQLREKISSPRIFYAKSFHRSVEKFRRLLGANISPNVFFSLDHPKYIWILCDPNPGRFRVNNARYGKWVVNYNNTEGPFETALKLVPYFAARQLGELKFELAGRGGSIFALIVYAQDRDALVKELVRQAAGREPFWVSDEFCYEADALTKIIEKLIFKVDVGRKWDPALLDRLKDPEFYRSRGISAVQAEILWRVFNADNPEYQSPDTDYAHVVAGYFTCADEKLEEALGTKTDHRHFMHLMLPVVFAEDNREMVHDFLSGCRQKFFESYTGEK